jgi:hypothetical protein
MLMKGDNPNVINIASIGAFALQKYVPSLQDMRSCGKLMTVLRGV